MKASRFERILAWAFLLAVYVFVLAPSLVLFWSSVNSARSFPSPFESFTLKWYVAAFQYSDFVQATQQSAIIAGVAAAIATVLSVPAAMALVKSSFPQKDAVITFFLSPLVVPQIAMGLAILQLLSLMAVKLGMFGLLVVHSVYAIPFVLRPVMAGLARFDGRIEEAARSLGGNRLQAIWYVVIPNIRASVTAGFVFAFLISFVNLPLSLLLTTPQNTTLPVVMFAYIESRLDPLIAAVGSFTVLAALAISLFVEKVLKFRMLG
jgi:putative spermidine/putrescine transport system permease protein